jgi:hypothetical protein
LQIQAAFLVFSDSQIPVRKWSYVMWDRARLDAWGILQTRWEGLNLNEFRREEQRKRDEEQEEFERLQRLLIEEGKLEEL